MDAQMAWPVVQHENHTWLDAYQSGWTQLYHLIESRACEQSPSARRWTVYCARYAWRSWPLATILDGCDTPGEAPAAWLEWELYRLSGDVVRLERCFQRWAGRTDARLPDAHPRALDPLWRVIDLQALVWIATALGRPDWECSALVEAAARSARQTPHAGGGAGPFDSELARLWLAQSSELGVQTAASLARQFAALFPHTAGNTPAHRSCWVQRGLLLLSLLRRLQEPEGVRRLAMHLLETCATAPDLHIYVPVLLIDGVLGCEPDAPAQFLSWWLYTSPPLGIDRLQIGAATVTCQAPRELGQGTQVIVRNSDILTLEILTPERNYLEHLAPGTHRLTLTVLDRTDVKTE